MPRESTNSDPSQESLILRRLDEARGGWVEMPELMRCSGSANIHSRIASLRKFGHDIRHRSEGNRPRKSFYQLVPKSSVA